MSIDINCDLGEGEPLELTEALMRQITSANIGSNNIKACVAMAKKYGVHIGAHPRHPAGRAEVKVTAEELEALLLEQVRKRQRTAAVQDASRSPTGLGVRQSSAAFEQLHHIKLHGALYHATDKDEALALRYMEVVQREWPGVIIYARCGGLVERVAKARGVPVWGEAFADRRYRRDGTLVPRSEPNALITEVQTAIAHAEEVVRRLKPQTLCIHSDTPNAPAIAEALRRMVQGLHPSSRE